MAEEPSAASGGGAGIWRSGHDTDSRPSRERRALAIAVAAGMAALLVFVVLLLLGSAVIEGDPEGPPGSPTRDVPSDAGKA